MITRSQIKAVIPPLARLANDPEALARAQVISQTLNHETAFIRSLILQDPRLIVPAGETFLHLVKSCCQLGFRPYPRIMRPAQSGNLFVISSQLKEPERMGVVAKVSTDGTWFYGVEGLERERISIQEVDYWLIPPGG